MNSKKYNYIFKFRLTATEKERLMKAAAIAGINPSAYLRALINNKIPQSREDYLLIKQLVAEINKIGVNINQIATHVNSGFYSEGEKRKLFALMNTIVKNTGDIIHSEGKKDESNKRVKELIKR